MIDLEAINLLIRYQQLVDELSDHNYESIRENIRALRTKTEAYFLRAGFTLEYDEMNRLALFPKTEE